MKNYLKFVCLIVTLVLPLILPGQKQDVQITFDIKAKDARTFKFKYYQVMDDLEEASLPVFISSFNEYISFISFTKDPQERELIITLANKPTDKNNYFLNFYYRNGKDTTEIITWDWLSSTLMIELKDNDVINFVERLQKDLPIHLYEEHNITYTKKVFNKLPIIVPDTSYYDHSGRDINVILPVERNELRLDIKHAEINAIMYGIDTDGDIIPSYKQRIRYIKDSREKHIGKCLTGHFVKEELRFTKYAHTEVFIDDYDYQPCLDCPGSFGDFFTSNN